MSAYETFASVYDLFMEQVEKIRHHAENDSGFRLRDRQYSASSGAGGLRCDWR